MNFHYIIEDSAGRALIHWDEEGMAVWSRDRDEAMSFYHPNDAGKTAKHVGGRVVRYHLS